MLDHKLLKTKISYDPATGLFRWIISPSNRVSAGSIAGSNDMGYIKISIDGIQYRAHRLAYFYMNGEWPKNQIDHKDMNRSNNSWMNLREATIAENNRNTRLRKDNSSGFKGVCRSGKKWMSSISVDGRAVRLGSFSTKEDAAKAYNDAAKKYHGDFAHISAQGF